MHNDILNKLFILKYTFLETYKGSNFHYFSSANLTFLERGDILIVLYFIFFKKGEGHKHNFMFLFWELWLLFCCCCCCWCCCCCFFLSYSPKSSNFTFLKYIIYMRDHICV